ncbi:MAG: ABC transporter ATP-binding protein [Nitrospirae bacterium]|nr:ABC transporter ATP-binding protein [Nitrospirota bacterium]MBI5696409.1 ABC transporter ATP-binding protein [Nitrospirota bacterium]
MTQDTLMTQPLLSVKGLRTQFTTREGKFLAVDGVSLDVNKGEVLGVVGESGCGKSVTALSIMRILPDPPGRVIGGEIIFEGRDLLKLPESEMRKVRGGRIGMVFQEPMTSLNPVFTVGDQVAEALVEHRSMTNEQALRRAAELFDLVGLKEPGRLVSQYPHQLSGGMRQRVMIAMAISCEPSLIIADEPTTALDVTIQAQILELLDDIRKKFGTAVMLITHDLGIIAQMADRVAVMYAGRVVEYANTDDIFYDPLHPYTEGLLASLPKPGEKVRRLKAIPGMVPKLTELPTGCKFLPRCPYGRHEYGHKEPELFEVKPEHFVRCFRASGE